MCIRDSSTTSDNGRRPARFQARVEPPARQSSRRAAERLSRRTASGLDEHRVQGAAAGHEQAVALAAAEADVGDDLRHADPTYALAVRCEYVNPVVALAHPAHAGPDVAVFVAPYAVGEAGLA